MRRILVLRGGALGDFIVTLPALALLRRGWPEARIELAGNAAAAALGQTRGLLDAVHSQHEARWAALFGAPPLPEPLAAWLGEFDLVVNYWPDPDGALARHFPRRTGQAFLSAAALPTCAPAAAHYCAPLRALNLGTETFRLPLQPLPDRRPNREREPRRARSDAKENGATITPTRYPGKGEAPKQPRHAHPTSDLRAPSHPSRFPAASFLPGDRAAHDTIAIHPGSGSPKKNWPLANWRALLRTLPSPVLLIAGEAEGETWRSLAGEDQTASNPGGATGSNTQPCPALALNLPLEELIHRLSTCRLFIGHDSGISHLAAACGVPCILLFGPTDPALWAPPGPHVRVVQRGPEMASISLADVRAALPAEDLRRR